MGNVGDLEAMLKGDSAPKEEAEKYEELATKRSLPEIEMLAWGVAEYCISIGHPERLDLQRCELAIKMAETAAKLRLTSTLDGGRSPDRLKTEGAAEKLYKIFGG